MNKVKKPIWEEFPPSKYNCSLARYTLHLILDSEFYEKYPAHEERVNKVKEAVRWVRKFPEVSML